MAVQKTFNYQEYLASREWAVLKNAVRDRSGGTCERCQRAPHEQTHHKTYERIGHELLEDLLGVCRPCHEYLSAKSEFDPANQPLKPTPFPLAPGSWFGDAAEQLQCPVCGFDYVHLVGARSMTSTPYGQRHDDYEAVWVRGQATRVHFTCEHQHHFSIDIGFHKGGTFLRVTPEFSTEVFDEPNNCQECFKVAV